MKKFVLFSLFIVLSIQNISFGVCPSVQEFQNKNTEFSKRSINISKSMNNNLPDNGAINALLKEQDIYYNNVLSGCIQYFKSTTTPDCSKISVMTSASLASFGNNQKQQVQAILNRLGNTCQYQVDIYKQMLK